MRCLKRFLAEDQIKREYSHGVRDHWQWAMNCAICIEGVQCTVYGMQFAEDSVYHQARL